MASSPGGLQRIEVGGVELHVSDRREAGGRASQAGSCLSEDVARAVDGGELREDEHVVHGLVERHAHAAGGDHLLQADAHLLVGDLPGHELLDPLLRVHEGPELGIGHGRHEPEEMSNPCDAGREWPAKSMVTPGTEAEEAKHGLGPGRPEGPGREPSHPGGVGDGGAARHEPPPAVTAKVTETSETGVAPSVTRTAGAWTTRVEGGAVWLRAETVTISVGKSPGARTRTRVDPEMPSRDAVTVAVAGPPV